MGISGVTNGGKTSLVKHLMKKFEGSEVIHQDDFFRSEDDEHHQMVTELNHANWESLTSVDWDKLLAVLESKLAMPPKGRTGLLMLDGHIIFNHPKLVELFDRKYFFTLSKEECFRRRQQRHYVPSDPPGYFDLVVWPMYLQNKQEMEQHLHDVVYLDGAADLHSIHQSVQRELQCLIDAR